MLSRRSRRNRRPLSILGRPEEVIIAPRQSREGLRREAVDLARVCDKHGSDCQVFKAIYERRKAEGWYA